jgi:uncharacterized protein YbdZ (MbtH family)
MIPGRGPNYNNNSKTIKGKYHWITNGYISKSVDILEPIPNGWFKGRIIKSKIQKPKKQRDARPFKYITDGITTLKYFEGDILPENFYFKSKNKSQQHHLYPKAPTIFINDGTKTISHPKHKPIPKGWKAGYSNKAKRQSKRCNLHLLKNIHTGETKLFSIDFIDENWKKFNCSQFSSDNLAPIKGRIGVKNKNGKIKYIKPEDKIPEGFEKISK